MKDTILYKIEKALYWGVMATCAVALVLGFAIALSSCSPSKQASKLFDKAARKNLPTVANKCSERFPPSSGLDSFFTYLPGETITDYDTVTSQDTVIVDNTVYVNKYITKTVTTRDTIYKKVTRTVHDKALETKQAADIVKLQQSLTKTQTTKRMLWWIVGIVGGLFIARFIFRWAVKKFSV